MKEEKTIEISGIKYKLVPVKEEKKTMALFTLTMPGVGSWNGKWSGSGSLYVRSRKVYNRGKQIYPNLKEGKFTYDFGDGWVAMVEVKYVTPSESRNILKKSCGFCGYDWMIDSLLKYGEIMIRQ